MPETIPSPARRNRDIECLRAVAVLAVMFHHMQGNLFHPGLGALGTLFQHAQFWFGVDVFLAISGFVIARSLLPQMAAVAGSLRNQLTVVGAFWIRRCWRLLPSAWLWLGLMLLASAVYNRSMLFGSVHTNLMATLAGMFDFANFRFADAFFRYPYGASFVYWSLSLEEQFYVLLPLAALCLRRRIDVLLVFMVIVQFFLVRTPLLMVVRTDALALGVLLAIALPTRAYQCMEPQWLLRFGTSRVLGGCIVLAALAVLASQDMQALRTHVGMIALLSAMLVWLASYDRDYLLPEGRLKQVLVWIGARSYAIYLIHIPMYFALRESAMRAGLPVTATLAMPAWLLGLLAFVATVILADINYRCIEQPLRRRGRLIAERFMRSHSRPTASEVKPVAPARPTNCQSNGFP